MKKRIIIKIALYGMLTLCLQACTKYDNPAAKFEEYEQPIVKTVQRKVLLISVDGLVGEELKKAIPPTLTKLMANGKYSFSALSDENSNDASTWTSMMTGYSSSKHRVMDDNYLPVASDQHEHDQVEFSPTVFYRILNKMPSLKTVVVTRDASLANVLLMDADEAITQSSDEAVKNAAIKEMENENTDFLTVQFKDVNNAGIANGFAMEQAGYKAAIETVDGYIGEIFASLQARENLAFEDWLVIVTSNHGGTVDGKKGGSSFAERNIFSLFYQQDFKSLEIVPELLSAPQFFGFDGSENGPTTGVRARNTTEAPGEEQYNAANTGKLTVEAKLKVNRNAAGNWNYSVPPFLSKVANRTGGTPGWAFFRNGNNVVFWCADGGSGIEIAAGNVSVDDKWAHITGTIEAKGETVTAKLFINGTLATEKTSALNIKNIKSTSPLTFGFQSSVFLGGFIDCFLTDIHIWNTVLSDSEILANSRRVGVAENHPKLANLTGFWPMNEGTEILRNMVPNMPDIPLTGKYSYKVHANNLPYVDENVMLLKNTDITSQVLYWFQITPQDDWSLEGESFLSKYEVEFLK